MANEIEFKINVGEEGIKKILDTDYFNSKNLCLCSFTIKRDMYFKPSKEGEVIRIRQNQSIGMANVNKFFEEIKFDDKTFSESYLCYKNKGFSDDGETEVTNEYETSIDDPEPFIKIMESKKSDVYFIKEKKSILIEISNDIHKNSYHIELVCVNNKHFYIEIEWVGDLLNPNFNTTDKVISYLEGIILELGFNPFKKDSRPWMEIVKND